MSATVKSYKYVDFFTRKILKAWVARERYEGIPWTKLGKALAECRVAAISSAGIALRDDEPFDREGERQNPWWGDPGYRLLPADCTEKDVGFYHLHTGSQFAEQDLNCVLPLQRLAELAELGEIGSVAPTHYSFMGYLLRPEQFLTESMPAIIERLLAEEVDAVLMVPF